MAAAMMYESIWFDRSKFEGGEAHYNKIVAGTMDGSPKKEGHKKEATLVSLYCILVRPYGFTWRLERLQVSFI